MIKGVLAVYFGTKLDKITNRLVSADSLEA